ncbi:VIT1/CCC1 transporter family protein [Microbacterium saperdae]|uniref:VIT1/CCC1 family predicted Fe2+/Mn2+ transporter n=1 Tax=Microbacterium saperdae TaxID=69368 RepID=A0A543BLF6_9MICO|nr:VIT family protein [Microbacterium saperdae]TQL85634.1 VIT1/CCC1 family predicted Fe2+/Mn2+ transporter [Microbacterium saperdae]GGM62066.1 membrane protein [Microbacterium saperdae]
MITTRPHTGEPRTAGIAGRLNWLRAGVLGANDGIVSVAAIVVGVAGATNDLAPILTAGTAALVGGAISMTLGEYVSVSSQSDSEKTLIATERRELSEMPAQELEELTGLYQAKGISPETARKVAEELTAHDALGAHLSAELNIDGQDLVSPWRAALASAVAFTSGGIIPFVAMLLPPGVRIPATFIVVLLALAVTGALGARLGGSPVLRPTIRVVVGGAVALGATFLIGTLLGTTGIA